MWLDRDDAFGQGLAYVNSAGNAILKVDNMHEVQYLQKRNSACLPFDIHKTFEFAERSYRRSGSLHKQPMLLGVCGSLTCYIFLSDAR